MNRVAIIENSKGLGSYFTKFLEKNEYEIFPVWNTSRLPLEDFKAYIFTGDFKNISNGLLPIHRKEIEFVKSIKDKKIFASCFFHQLCGVIFGGKVAKREKRFLGWHKMDIENDHEILKGLDKPFYLNLNVDEIIEKPENAEVLATNQDCKYQVLQYGENIFTCQSHPEIYKQEALDLIKEHREGLTDRCPDLDDVVEQTKRYADDKSNETFLSNMTKWLLS